jgi:hypothetical protein
MNILEKTSYHQYTEWCYATNFGDILYEGKISDSVAQVLDFAKKVAKEYTLKLRDLFKLFFNKDTFKFFTELRWDFESFKKLVSAGSKLLSIILNPVQGILTAVFPDLISKKIHSLNSLTFSKEQLQKIDEWVKKNKKLLLVSGVAFAGLYIIIWLTMSKTGDLTYDFDISDLLRIITGKLTLFSFLSSESGTKTLILFFIGLITGGLTINFIKNAASVLLPLLVTIATSIGLKLSKGKDSSTEIDKLEKDFIGV